MLLTAKKPARSQAAFKIDAERAEFERIVAAGIFPPHSNSARLLEFVCRKYFEGEDNLTEYTIATEALNRRPGFTPKQDSIVRVEAHRVRKRLLEFYENEGAGHPLHLALPVGSYLPTFVPGEHNPPAPPDVALERPPKHPRILINIGIAVVLIMAITSPILLQRGRKSKSTQTATMNRAPVSIPVLPDSVSELRIIAGSDADEPFTDRLGHVWLRDRFFVGGQTETAPYREIFRTDEPQLFLSFREGHDFRYDIPVKRAIYELRLYFAETLYGQDNHEGGGESSRIFDVSANGVPILTNFDPLSDAGGSNTADVRVFEGIAPAADGKLHLSFHTKWPLKGTAFVNAIELSATRTPEMAPLRWIAGPAARLDSFHRLWLPDQFSLNGRFLTHRESTANTNNPELYRSERYGNFSYAIPVPNGSYTLTLYFSEHWFGLENGGGNDNMRLFDVYCNGIALLRNANIMHEAGGSARALVKRFTGLKPNAQGKLLLSFVPTSDYANVNAIEIVPEGRAASAEAR